MRRLFLAALAAIVLALFCPSPARGFGKNKIAYERFDWHVYTAPHFDVYYYPEEANQLDQVVSYAESQYLRLSQILDHEIKFRISLIYYRTHVEFEQTNITLGFIPEFVAAFAEPIANRMVLPVDEPPDKLFTLIGHELTHVFQFSILYQESLSRAFRATTPTWVTEGMASHLGQDEDNIDRMIIRDAVVNGLIPPIHKVNALTFLTYRYGQAAFQFIEDRYGQEGLRNFVWEFRKSLLTSNIEKPIKDAFGIEADEFDRQFKRYLQKKYLPDLLEKKEPEDYGKPITAKRRPGADDDNVVTFSPALSPSGELIAVITTRWEDLDVAIVSAKDGKVIRNLTKGFTNKWDYLVYGAFQGKNDLTWSPEGDKVAFFVRRENERALAIFNAVRGDLDRVISIPGVDDELSPSWSADGKRIAFEGIQAGVTDIFAYVLDTGEITNLTQDEFYDSNPSWSLDGKQILYDRRINAYTKIFMVDAIDPTRKVQLTFGDSSDLQPSFARDGKTVFYTSDQGSGIFNLHSLSLETGEIRRLTDVVGGIFTPLELPDEGGRASLAFASYGGGRFRLFRMAPGEPESIQRPADLAREPAELQPFEPPLRLTLDEDKKKRYEKLSFHIENAPSVLVGVANDGTVLSNAQVLFSDLLGDHRMLFNFQSVSTFSNFYFSYINLKRRLNWDVFATDYRDFYTVESLGGSSDRVRQYSRYTGAGFEIAYPFNRFYRIGASVGVFDRSIDRPVSTFQGIDFVSIKETYPQFSWTYDGDTTRYKEFGPYHGQRFQLRQDYAPTVKASGDVEDFVSGPFVRTSLDYRLYRRATSRSLLAVRLAGVVSNGAGYGIYSMGGLNELRGYDYREFYGSRISFLNVEYRFPLIDFLAFPFGGIRDIRAFLFFDLGTAWFGGDNFAHPDLGLLDTLSVNGEFDPRYPIDPNTGLGFNRRFKFWDSEHNKLGDGRASYGFGWNFYLGPFQLTWSFARQLSNTVETVDLGTLERVRIDDPFHENGTVSQFYIAREF